MAKQYGIPPSALRSRLRQGKIAPVYLIAGEEPFLVDEAISSIAEAVASSGGCSKSFHHGNEANLATVLDDVRTMNLFSPSRLVTVAPADRFVEKYNQRLAAYTQSPAPNGCLVFVVVKADGRRRFTAEVKKAGGLVACNRVREDDIVPWVRARAKAMNRRIDSAAAARLAEFLGTDLAALAGELEKLAIYVGSRGKIATDDVEAVSLRDRSRVIYELTDALGRRQPAQVLAILDQLLAHGGKEGKPTSILFQVSRHVRRLWQAKELIGKGVEPKTAAEHLGIRHFVDQFLGQVEMFTIREFRENCSALLDCEGKLKSSAVDSASWRILLETTFLRLVRRQNKAAGTT